MPNSKLINAYAGLMFTFIGVLTAAGLVLAAKKASEGLISPTLGLTAMLILGLVTILSAGGAFTFFSWMLGYPRKRK